MFHSPTVSIVTTKFEVYVPVGLEGYRLDRALAQLTDCVSRTQVKTAILAGAVTVAGTAVTNPRHTVRSGDLVHAVLEEQVAHDQIIPIPLDLAIIAEEDEYLVIDKPAGLVVHPARGHSDDTLANAVAAHSVGAAALPRAGIVHRLDKDTSGLLVVAKTEQARLNFIQQFKERTARRLYLTIVHGRPTATGVVDRPIGKDRGHRLKMAVSDTGRPALTRYQLIDANDGFSLLNCWLTSGRTHQIRVHMEYIGHPVAGDRLYRRHARAEGGICQRQMLHAHELDFYGPADGILHKYQAPLPADFQRALADVGLRTNPT